MSAVRQCDTGSFLDTQADKVGLGTTDPPNHFLVHLILFDNVFISTGLEGVPAIERC